ncbi:MAG: ATP-binding protein, partial [Solirubrobacteraceae bacterium]
MTEQKQMQAQLAQSSKMQAIGQLAGGVAHDFNNLLAVILNYATFVSEAAIGASAEDSARWQPVADDVAQIERAAERAGELTHQLLAFARREVVQPRPLDINSVIREVEPMLRRTLGEHVGLETTLDRELWVVAADPGQLEQVLVNLAVNARDAMPAGGTLTVDTANVDIDEEYAAGRPGLRPGRYVLMRVSDTGVGMEPSVAEHAFEPFFTTKADAHGTGLGLATVYGIVTQAKGSVRVYSEPGIGTTFTVALPAVSQPAATTVPAAPQVGGARGGTLLVVEDEDAIRTVAERILGRAGYVVLSAASGPEAITIARGHPGPIHLLLTDVVMPKMRGTELADKLRGTRPELRVLYMSGYAPPAFGTNGMLGTGAALLEKPFSQAALLHKVSTVLD